MRSQRLDVGKMPREVSLGDRGVDFLVTNMVQQNRLAGFSAFQFWHKVMP